ncbi:DUF1592 domain-containing protein [Lentisphaera profundi]|uniref:DUF1592 domain-containing protein n=1 Tax=Lentisphaera profundi TaxID=1658616 RepID=A0ABY7VXB8_9BACT|nr:DUF1592 domain-containing protein [Lentisphaera profundi]WDE98868.1 DUF1592 domain-containing protein [Lentisphaera profundi]
MNKLFNLATALLLTCLWTRESFAAKADASLNLTEARKFGRAKSNLLHTKTEKKSAEVGEPKANLADFEKEIGPILKANCIDCHGPKKAKGRFRVDTLDANLLKGKDINDWLEVFDVLTNEEMPPEDEPDYHLADKERSRVVEWLGEEMNKASQVQRHEQPHSSFRRMTKNEYNYALQDLLGEAFSFAEDLPTETISEDGFTNSSEHLTMSAMQFQAYRELGLKALQKVIVKGERPAVITYQIPMQRMLDLSAKNLSGRLKKKRSQKIEKLKKEGKEKEAKDLMQQELVGIDDKNIGDKRGVHLIDLETGKGWASSYNYAKARWALRPDEVQSPTPKVSQLRAVIPNGHSMKLDLGNFLADKGDMRVRIRTGKRELIANKYSSLQLIFGGQTSNNASFEKLATEENLLIEASAESPQFVQFDIPLSEMPRNPFRKSSELGGTPTPSEVLTLKHVSNGAPPIEIDYIEISSPVYEQWPPKSHASIFIESKNKKNEPKYAREILAKFTGRAWRRPIQDQDLDPLIVLFNQYRPQFDNFDDAMLEVLATVLASPEFLYITSENSKLASAQETSLSDLALASRLSYFLWSSIPDAELLTLAKSGQLSQPKILEAQIERMLNDPRAQRFSKVFVEEWLGLEALKHINLDKKLFSSFNEDFRKDMLLEPVAYFNQVLKENKSIMDFIHSDFIVVNERLAKHYGITEVYGEAFRKVQVKDSSHRGGILSSSGLLTMNSDGKDSHPLKRGIWLLENILHDPPPPAPPNVPEVDLTDPEILKMTLKERIEDHRNQAACRSCHAKIDPWGIAFENYDAMGAFRNTVKNKPVDATSELFNKQELSGIEGLKRYLLVDRQDQFTRAMIHKMTSYALGRPMSFSDRADIDEMAVEFRKQGDGLRDLIALIINSELFHKN